MVRSQNKILLIVEGEMTEPKLLKKLALIKWNEEASIEIVDVRTNIYALYKTIVKLDEGFFEGATSIIELLKEKLKNENRFDDVKKLQNKFPYIYLIFDFELQDNHFLNKDKFEILNKMLDYFNDETENGLLTINYPMIESYRDYNEPLPDAEYKYSYVTVNDIVSHNYKKIVGKRGCNKNINKYTIRDFELIFYQNICKANYIVNNEYIKPSYYEFTKLVLGKDILKSEIESLINNKNIKILCTSLYIFVYYFGEKYYLSINKD